MNLLMASWLEELERLTNDRLKLLVGNKTGRNLDHFLKEDELAVLERKKLLFSERDFEIVKAMANGRIIQQKKIEGLQYIDYMVHHQYLVKQPNEKFYLEENMEERQAIIKAGQIISDSVVERDFSKIEVDENEIRLKDIFNFSDQRQKYQYNRRAAVQYAERWWNSYNPKYKRFKDDCTNFISQCLHEGGIPMSGFGDRNKGWWYSGNSWSYSWAVAHAFRWHLSGANKQQGIYAKEVRSASDLSLGDVICYDFEGDGRWNHNTIVVAKDANNEPLVNAHTYNSRMRYWAYKDSSAYTPNIKYKFFHILDRK